MHATLTLGLMNVIIGSYNQDLLHVSDIPVPHAIVFVPEVRLYWYA